MFIQGLAPILWLIVALSVLKLPAWKACPIALIIAFIVSWQFFGMPLQDVLTGTLEGAAMAVWPILGVIVAAIFAYNLTVHTGGMEKIKDMLSSVSTDKRMLILIIGWGFGAFLECMSGFGTAVAIGASMLVTVGVPPVNAVIACLVSNAAMSSFGSVGLPLTTLAKLTNFDPLQIATYTTLQLGVMVILMPFIMLVAFGGLKCLKGMIPACLIGGFGFCLPSVIGAATMGADLAGIAGAVFAMAALVVYAKKFPIKDPEYEIDDYNENFSITVGEAVKAWLPFILIFVFLMLSSKLFPPIQSALASVKTSVMIYTGEGATPLTFQWLTAPGTLIFISAVIAGFINNASVGDMLNVLNRTFKTLIPTFITIITIIATARIMGYSGMTMAVATATVSATGTFYPFISPLIGSVGAFITGSATSSCVLLSKLQVDSAVAIGLGESAQAWIAAANAAGSCVGKIISPQSIAIGAAAVGAFGVESQIMKFAVKVYLPFILITGCVVYFGQVLL
ncbi:MAG: lactate permease LctP family transporter [Selenomonadaceae bacterium]|nr:lactate permease LctP family transporter [Selenomonadaceae bacterium]